MATPTNSSRQFPPGTVHASHGVVAVLKRLVPRIRQRWPDVAIELRADSGFAIPALYDYCEAEHLGYTIGLVPNARLQAERAPAHGGDDVAGHDGDGEGPLGRRNLISGRLVGDGTTRRLQGGGLAQGPQHSLRGRPSRRPDPPEALYDWYVDRGEPELSIKDLKGACFADRLSCHRFWANQFRLLLHAAAYWLLDTLRRWLVQRGVPRMQLDTLRLRLIKIAGWVRQLLTKVRLHLAERHPGRPLWNLLATRKGRLRIIQARWQADAHAGIGGSSIPEWELWQAIRGHKQL